MHKIVVGSYMEDGGNLRITLRWIFENQVVRVGSESCPLASFCIVES
jgi:hypothetical protein